MPKSRNEVPPSLVVIVRQQARRTVRSPGFCRDEYPDVEQSLYLKLLQGMPRHDASKGSAEAFAQTIVQRESTSLKRRKRAAKRAPGRSVPLHTTIKVGEGEYTELSQSIGQRELSARTGADPREEHDASQLKQDVDGLLARLSEDEQDLLERLKWDKVATVARDLDIPPTTIHSRLLKYRQQFEDAGLREYLR